MRSPWTKLIPLLLVILLLSACAESRFKTAEEEIPSETYSSQFIVGDVYVLKKHEQIDGNLVGIGTTLVIEDSATVIGDISLIGSQMEVFGRVAGDINVFAGTTYVHKTAIITGSINQIAHQINIEPGAQISGEINTFTFPAQSSIGDTWKLENVMGWLQPAGWIAFQLIRNLFLVLITVLIIFLFKMPILHVAHCIKKHIAVSWGTGLLVMVAVPIVSLFLIITICLSPIGLILILALLIAGIWGWAGMSFVIGENLTRWLKLDWPEEARVAVGAVMLGLASTLLAFLPGVGFMISAMVSAIGLGGVVLSKFGTIEEK